MPACYARAVVATAPDTSTPAPDQDQRILMHGMSWWQFETILAVRGDNLVPRIAYLIPKDFRPEPPSRHDGHAPSTRTGTALCPPAGRPS